MELGLFTFLKNFFCWYECLFLDRSSEAQQPGSPAASRLCCAGGTAPAAAPGLQCTGRSAAPCPGTAAASAEGPPRLGRTGAPKPGRLRPSGGTPDGVPSGEGSSFSLAWPISGRESPSGRTQGDAAGGLGGQVLGPSQAQVRCGRGREHTEAKPQIALE